MRILVLLLTISFLYSCGQNELTQKELESKEKEIALKEKGLAKIFGDTLNLKAPDRDTINKSQSQPLILPFIGIRSFETQPGVSGSGTPMRDVEILENGDVFFSFLQINQADGTETKERYYSGKLKSIMKCYFKKLGNETTYYKIGKGKIIEVDKSGNVLYGSHCCSLQEMDKDECPCESIWN